MFIRLFSIVSSNFTKQDLGTTTDGPEGLRPMWTKDLDLTQTLDFNPNENDYLKPKIIFLGLKIRLKFELDQT